MRFISTLLRKGRSWNSEKLLIIAAGAVGVLLILITLFDGIANQCERSQEGIVIHDNYVATIEAQPFLLLWSFQFLRSDLLATSSPHGSMGQSPEVSAQDSQQTQNQLVEDINSTKCDVWGYLQYAAIFFAILIQIAIVGISLKRTK